MLRCVPRIEYENLEKVLEVLPEPEYAIYQMPGLNYQLLEKEVNEKFLNAVSSLQEGLFKVNGVTKKEILKAYKSEISLDETIGSNPRNQKWLREIKWDFETITKQEKRGFEVYDRTKRYGIKITPNKIMMDHYGKEPKKIENVRILSYELDIPLELKIN